MQIRLAHPRDVRLIVQWRQEAAQWLAAHGTDQWSTAGLDRAEFRRRVSESVARGETWIATDNQGTPVGTIAIDTDADPGLWNRAELENAVIIHRMIVPRHASGLGVGGELLAQADEVAVAHGRMFVRLDAWTSNAGLHDYYRRAGFRHVRTVDQGTPSGALFERRVWAVPMPAWPSDRRCDP